MEIYSMFSKHRFKSNKPCIYGLCKHRIFQHKAPKHLSAPIFTVFTSLEFHALEANKIFKKGYHFQNSRIYC